MDTSPPGDPLRIAFVSSHARRGGSERYLETLLGELGAGWVECVVALESGPLVERLRGAYPVEVVESSGRAASIAAAAWRLRRILRRRRPELVHANGVKAALVSVLAVTGLRLPVVWVKHDFSWDGRLARAVARRCALVVGVSEAVLRALPSAVRTRVVPTGIPPLPAPGGPPAGLPAGGPVVGVFGYLHPLKGQLELVEAAPAVLAARPDARFAVVGGDDRSTPGYASAVRSRVDELGVSAAFTFLGHRDDAVDLLRACALVTIPTLGPGEGFGLVAAEALAAGTPVVGYDGGALPEVVGECGVLVAQGDRAALAEAIARVLGDSALRDRLAACGRGRARERLGLDRWRDGLVAAYREAR